MTEICPAGPPKLSNATRTHTRTASRKETPWSVLAAVQSATALHVGKIECRTQPPRELLRLIVSPEVHEKKMW